MTAKRDPEIFFKPLVFFFLFHSFCSGNSSRASAFQVNEDLYTWWLMRNCGKHIAASGFGLYFLERDMGSGNPTIYVHLVIFIILLVTLIKTQLLDVKPI